MVGLGDVMMTIAGPRKQICSNNAKAYTHGPLCVAQGYSYALGTIWTTAWGFCSSVEVYMKIVR
jgi:hypothetical protein